MTNEKKDENKNMVTTTETVEKDVKQNTNTLEPKAENDWKKEHRDELNRMFAAERENERNKVLNEVQQQKDEAKKLEEMDELQKKDYEIESLKKQLQEKDLNEKASNLKDEAIKQATEKGVPISIMNTLNYKNETAESIKEKIDIYSKEIQGIKTNVINEFSKEEAPQTGDNNRTEMKTGYEKFAENYNK